MKGIGGEYSMSMGFFGLAGIGAAVVIVIIVGVVLALSNR